MIKVVMNLENFKGKYAMHCICACEAEYFRDFMEDSGRKLLKNNPYSFATEFYLYDRDTVYLFNEGLVSSVQEAKEKGYKILEIGWFLEEVI